MPPTGSGVQFDSSGLRKTQGRQSIRMARIENLSSSDTSNSSALTRRSKSAVEKAANHAVKTDASATNRQPLSWLRYSLDWSGLGSGAFKERPKASVSEANDCGEKKHDWSSSKQKELPAPQGTAWRTGRESRWVNSDAKTGGSLIPESLARLASVKRSERADERPPDCESAPEDSRLTRYRSPR